MTTSHLIALILGLVTLGVGLTTLVKPSITRTLLGISDSEGATYALRLHVDDVAVAVDDAGALARADAEHDDAEEIAEVVPAAVVGHGIMMAVMGLWFLLGGLWSVNGPDLPAGEQLRQRWKLAAAIILYGGTAVALGYNIPR